MASLRDIRRRIKSVKNTRQITKALELVAASKMKKAQQAANAGRAYAALMAEMLAAVAGRVEETQHPFLARREVKVRGIILVHFRHGPRRRAQRQPLQARRRRGEGTGEVRRHRPQGRPVHRAHQAPAARRFPDRRPACRSPMSAPSPNSW
ncbi:MAG: F0F1 ATP synthase subunit gamma [Lacunisphaera sp.]